jgi:hypothetical protein
MRKLKWWFLIVGIWYLFLALANLGATLLDSQLSMYTSLLPPPLTGNAVAARGFADAWFAFVMDMLAIGGFCVWASRTPLKFAPAVWLIVLMEFLHGVVDDAFLIARGYDAVSYLVFTAIHLIIIITGILFVRQAMAKATG